VARSEGYVRQRSPGSWTITLSLGRDAAGKPQQLVKTIRGTKKDADAERARLILERDQGVDLRPETVTVGQLMDRWMESRRPYLNGATPETYDALIKTHIVPCLGKLKLRDVRPLHIEDLKTAVLAKGRSQKSALNVFRIAKAAFKQAVDWDLISRNPCDRVTPPRASTFRPFTPGPEQLGVILAEADQTPYGPIARLAALTGARQAELLRLRWRDVDWEHQRLTIRGTKTVASARLIDLAPLAMDLLHCQRQAEREKKLLLGSGAPCGTNDATIFTNVVGKPMDAGGLKRTWKRVIRKAEVGHVRFHDLRHCAASYMIAAGVPITMVSQRLGHSRVSTTTDIYAHVLPGMGREAAQVLENVMVSGWSRPAEGAQQA